MNRTDDMVGYLIEQLRRAENEQAEMLVAALVGQLKNHLYRWKEIYEKWSNNELVQRYCDLREVPWWIRDRKAS